MDIIVQLAFQEPAALRLLNWLAHENARIFRVYDGRARKKGEASLPGLYESGIVYEPEEQEEWADYLNTLLKGWEDCDALAAIRAGELMARGWRALRPRDPRDPVRYPGDDGFRRGMNLKPRAIKAEVMLTTSTTPGQPGLYHCIVRYWIGGKEFRDDPSARLGMLGDPDSPEVKQGLVLGPGGRFKGRGDDEFGGHRPGHQPLPDEVPVFGGVTEVFVSGQRRRRR